MIHVARHRSQVARYKVKRKMEAGGSKREAKIRRTTVPLSQLDWDDGRRTIKEQQTTGCGVLILRHAACSLRRFFEPKD
jgi:hypothetical protein